MHPLLNLPFWPSRMNEKNLIYLLPPQNTLQNLTAHSSCRDRIRTENLKMLESRHQVT